MTNDELPTPRESNDDPSPKLPTPRESSDDPSPDSRRGAGPSHASGSQSFARRFLPHVPYSRRRHVIWDWNGTLFDDVRLCVEIVNRLLAERGKPTITLDRYRDAFDFPVEDYYRKIGFDYETEPYENLATNFIAEYERRRAECRLRPGAETVLRALRDRGLTQSVLSAYKQIELEEAVTAMGLRGFFANLAGLDNHYAAGKIEIGKCLLSRLGASPSDILLVGDTRHDYEVAGAMGIDCVLIPGGHQSRERLLACGAPVLVSLDELVERLDRIE